MIRYLAAAAVSFSLAMALSGGPAAAQDAGKPNPGARLEKAFQKLDRNKDGVLDRSEIEAQRARQFQRLDANKDGAIDQSEIEAVVKKREAKGGNGGDKILKQFKAADRDGDGRVTKAEFIEKLPPWFKRADANGDGKVTRKELEDFIAERGAKREKRGDARDEQGAGDHKGDHAKKGAAKTDAGNAGDDDDDDPADDAPEKDDGKGM